MSALFGVLLGFNFALMGITIRLSKLQSDPTLPASRQPSPSPEENDRPLTASRQPSPSPEENDQPLTASRQPSPSPEENDQPLTASRQPSLDEDPDKITVLEDSETGKSRAKQNRPNSAFRKIYS